MALNKAQLKTDIQNLIASYPSSLAAFANGMASTYISYAGQAIDFTAENPTGITAKQATLSSALQTIMSNTSVVNPLQALDIMNALVIVWTGISFKITVPPPGWIAEITSLVTVPGIAATGAVILSSLLTSTNESFSNTAQTWADAMDAFTKTVTVTITGTMPGPSGPIPAVPIIATIT